MSAKTKKTSRKKGAGFKVSQTQRTLGYVVFAFFLGAAVGFTVGFNPQPKGSEAKTDSYGRSPGDEHYLHKHP